MSFYTIYNPELKIWHGPEEDFSTTTPMGEVFLTKLKANPDKVFQVFHDTDEEMTGLEMYQKSVRLANCLIERGIKKGDIITIATRNLPLVTPLGVAILSLGAIVNYLDEITVLRMNEENQSVVHTIGPKILFIEAPFAQKATEYCGSIPIVTFGANDHGYPTVEDMVKHYEQEDEYVPTAIKDTKNTVAVILASSGTTGVPKFIQLSHAMIMSELHRCTLTVDVGTSFNPSPMNWVSAMDSCFGILARGKRRIITIKPPTGETIVEIVQKYQVTEIFCDPSKLIAALQNLNEGNEVLSSIGIFGCAGTLVSEHLRTSMAKYCPNGFVVIGYGLSEVAGLAVAALYTNQGFSVGQLLRGMEIKIVGHDNVALGPNETGEVLIRTPNPFFPYFKNETATKAALTEDGWLHTFDMGYFDDEGFLFILGRKQDQLVYLHNIINPIEIESIIEKHEGVQQACVVGVSVIVYGDMPTAIIVRKPKSTVTTEELGEWLKDKLPEKYKLQGGIFFIDALPTTPSGKIKKRIVRELAFQWSHEAKAKAK